MEPNELLALCLSFADAYEDYPFGPDWVVLRHRSNHKSFANLFERPKGVYCVNLKLEPLKADFLRSVYNGVTPGYHMNKTHWSTVVLNSDVPAEEIQSMVRESYELTRNGAKRSG